MNFRGLQVVILCYSCIPIVLGRSNGAPDEACTSMTPGHSSFTFQDQKTLPYSISFEPGCSTVIIQGTDLFKGFLLKAVNERNETVGKFLKNSEKTKLACGERAVTHSERLNDNQIGLRWDSGGFVGTVYFTGTIVKNFSNFWSIRSSSCDAKTLFTTASSTTTTTAASMTTTAATTIRTIAAAIATITATKTTTAISIYLSLLKYNMLF